MALYLQEDQCNQRPFFMALNIQLPKFIYKLLDMFPVVHLALILSLLILQLLRHGVEVLGIVTFIQLF